jgi:DNA-binding PadR family transcriptional regulator
MHGYAVGKWIRQSTNDGLIVQEGALYPALHRLERRGFLAEQWGMTESNREAKFYKLTASGRAQLKREIARWEHYARFMTAALARTG